ncbi:MAG: transcriptional repressor [Gammaproteobacteria bacterium]|nr:transcriptional repressor [Gammaproteobacteria bacterium]NND59345.1 transcriptional repressor [Gammaproteobacteria bacterium]
MLEARGISATRQRREIARVLLGKAQHVTAEQLMDELALHGQAISKATVYNTLKLFVDKGLLREVHVDATRTVYDTTTTPHHHFYNADSGQLSDIPLEEVAITALPNPPEGTVSEGVDVIVRIRNR